ncbi:MAG TPA: ferrochelatase [Candidatus Thermoplasmatota archaeon]|nr:ferrochelatase [Candidatus Thermoplasmatota archaeon]
MTRLGVLLTSYGSASGLGDVPRYLEHILGKPPTTAQVEGLRARYAALGGTTPLHETTRRQAELLRAELASRGDFRVAVGMKHSEPFISDAARELCEAGVERGVVVPLAPQDSRMSVGGYHKSAREALASLPGAPPFSYVSGFATHPLLVQAWADRVETAWVSLPGPARETATVLFTAHSLPQRVLEWNDPYPGEVRRTCEAIAQAAGLPRWRQAYQSAVPGSPWLGPDVLDELSRLAEEGARTVVVAPIGFVSDHLETLYDLDIEAKARAEKLGLRFLRCRALNDDPRFVRLLADVAMQGLTGP